MTPASAACSRSSAARVHVVADATLQRVQEAVGLR